jgi:hypothetical protein
LILDLKSKNIHHGKSLTAPKIRILDPDGSNLARRSQCCQKKSKSFEKFPRLSSQKSAEPKKNIAASFLPGRLKKCR